MTRTVKLQTMINSTKAKSDVDSDDSGVDERTECPICLGLVKATQQRKIMLLRKQLCKKCYGRHYINKEDNKEDDNAVSTESDQKKPRSQEKMQPNPSDINKEDDVKTDDSPVDNTPETAVEKQVEASSATNAVEKPAEAPPAPKIDVVPVNTPKMSKTKSLDQVESNDKESDTNEGGTAIYYYYYYSLRRKKQSNQSLYESLLKRLPVRVKKGKNPNLPPVRVDSNRQVTTAHLLQVQVRRRENQVNPKVQQGRGES